MNNRSLKQEPRYEPAAVIPLKQDSSFIDWLKSSNRLIPRQEKEVVKTADEEEEFEGLIDEDTYVDEQDTANTIED